MSCLSLLEQGCVSEGERQIEGETEPGSQGGREREERSGDRSAALSESSFMYCSIRFHEAVGLSVSCSKDECLLAKLAKVPDGHLGHHLICWRPFLALLIVVLD
eukprot:COSAG06_NODE_1199_length_10293_cov_7.500392_4_plen_104_part_00